MLKEISEWLVTKLPTLTIGGNLQVGWHDIGAPVRCHTLTETGGPGDWYIDGKIDCTIQVTTRAATYQNARDDAWQIYNLLQGTAGWQIPALVSGGQAYMAMSIEALAAPQFLGFDEKGAFEFTTNYIFRMKKA